MKYFIIAALAVVTATPGGARADGTSIVTINKVPPEKAQPLATRFIRSPGINQRLVRNPSGESAYDVTGRYLGDVKGMVVSLDGSKQAVVFGVGVGLGLGEQEIAIDYSYLQRNGGIAPGRVVLPMTGEQLRGAPSFTEAGSPKP
jgi:hypothetical protein